MSGIAHKWRPIEKLNQRLSTSDFREIDSLHAQWLNVRRDREDADPDAYKDFLERVYRRWSIETGIIEGIYDINRGLTQTLVEKGLNANLIDRGSTDKNPDELIQVLTDHRDTADFVTTSIKRGQTLSNFYVRQLHSILLRNQEFYDAYDQFGSRFDAPLDRGGFKSLPNNPTRPDGKIHEYCPPEQVESELDCLANLYASYDSGRINHHPLLVSAWLHHRFSQIHPFQDGNGRVARALLTWHMAKNDYLPVVISRDEREEYIESLEHADSGDLMPFFNLIVRLERSMILDALGEPSRAPDTRLVSQVLGSITERVKNRRQQELARVTDRRQTLNRIAVALQGSAIEFVESQAKSIVDGLHEAGLMIERFVESGEPGRNDWWYRSQVVETARESNHWANLNEDRYWVKLSINPLDRSQAPRLIFVVSLHHVGRQFTGIMAATAFAQILSSGSAQDIEVGERGVEEQNEPDFRNCAVDAFLFTSDDEHEERAPRFTEWIEESLSVALSHWSEFVE